MYCPKCGWKNSDDAIKCSNCFTELRQASQQPAQTQQMPQQPYSQQPYGQQPYQQPYASPYAYSIPNYMTWAIIILVLSVLCCAPIAIVFSIISLVKVISVNKKKEQGDYAGAMAEANSARTMLIVATVILIIGFIVGLIIGFSQGIEQFRHELKQID